MDLLKIHISNNTDASKLWATLWRQNTTDIHSNTEACLVNAAAQRLIQMTNTLEAQAEEENSSHQRNEATLIITVSALLLILVSLLYLAYSRKICANHATALKEGEAELVPLQKKASYP